MERRNKNSRRIPKNRIFRTQASCGKAICQKCFLSRRVRHMTYYKGRYLCYTCRKKELGHKIMSSVCSVGRSYIDLQTALNKTYEVKMYVSKNNKSGDKQRSCLIHLPSVLAGRKIKIVLEED